MKIILFKFLILSWAFANLGFIHRLSSVEPPFNFKVSQADGIPSVPPATFSPKETITFLPQIPKVNVITGEYCDEECDLLVAGIEPLSINRFYNHFSGIYNRTYGHWRLNPETFMLFNFEPIGGCQTLAAVGENNSSFFVYEKPVGNSYQIDTLKNKSFTNLSSLPSGQDHPLNTKVSYSKGQKVQNFRKSLRQPEDHCWWEGIIKDGSGRERVFRTDVRQWPQAGKAWPAIRYTHPVSGELSETPLEFTAPYQATITEERKPNGNILRYEYEDVNTTNPTFDHELPTTYVLKSIKAYAKSGMLLGSIAISYAAGGNQGCTPNHWFNQVSFTGSDGRKVTFINGLRQVNSRRRFYDTVLDRVEASGKPLQNYNYIWKDAQNYYNMPFMFQAGRENKFLLETNYDPTSKKVVSQTAPIGTNGQMLPIARYEYQNDHTIVYDGENNKIVYRYNADKRIVAVEKYQGAQFYSVERNEWDSVTGNLLRKKFENTSGILFSVLECAYDKNHNLISQKSGDNFDALQNGDSVTRTFSDDGFNLKKSESDRPGKEIKYAYLPGTNLLSSEFVYHHGHICKRIFHFYDSEIGSARIKTIVDDGKTENPNDFSGITFRKIIEISPKRSLPCLGLPEEIREKTIDGAGNEILLKKVRYTYHPCGKVAREDHFDANNNWRYAILNEFDAKERLIATTDALGHKTQFAYDANFNLVSQTGPRADMHKEWVYDLANRPVQEKERQTDGSVLATHKKYDKANRIIASIDECGFETCYDYDSLGRVIAIRHPDGAREQKEYDILGNVIQETDANGYKTQKTYNFRGQPISIYHPDGTAEHFTYNPNGGSLASHTDTKGIKTLYVYDLFDNPVQTDSYSADGVLFATTKATFSPFCKLSETDANGVTTYFTYDFAGRKIAERKGEKLNTYQYDELGRLFCNQEGDFATIFTYDLNGQLIEKKIEGSKLFFQEKYGYDESGNRTNVETCNGKSQTVFNSRREPIRYVDPLGNQTEISYSYQNRFIKTTTDPKGIQAFAIHDSRKRLVDLQVKNVKGEIIQRREKKYDLAGNQTQSIEHLYDETTLKETITHQWVYGPMGRIERLIEAGIKETRYVYDNSGRLQSLIKPDGEQIHIDYDGLSRLARYWGNGLDYRYKYDQKNRLTEITDKIHSTLLERSYDIYDHLTNEKLDSGITIRSEYNPYGKKTVLHLPDNSKAVYSYDGPYLFAVERKGFVHTYSERNLAGKPTSITLPNQAKITIKLDPALRWSQYETPHFAAKYKYDEVGNLTECDNTDSLGQKKYTYCYDDLNQVLSENEDHYTYDSLYNRKKKNENSYSLNSLCQVTCDGLKTYTYDKNGNLISDGECTFEYDVLDRLIAIYRDTKKTTFTYDAFNRRIAKNKDLYIWDDKNEIGMMCNGKIQELRILGEGFGAEIGAAVFLELNGETYFPIHDQRGSLVSLLHSKNNPLTYRYTAFGEQLAGEKTCPWRFASKRHDPETGFIYFGRRYYSPQLGRWITADPKGFKDGPNLYAYVKNSPLLAIDLYGEKAQNSSVRQDLNDFWCRLEGAGHFLRDLAFNTFSKMGGWVWSSKDSIFETNSFRGNWETLSWKNPSDYSSFAYRTFLPYSYDLNHLPCSTSREDRLRAEGAATFEKFLFAYSGARMTQGCINPNTGLSKMTGESVLFLTSRERVHSGLTGIASSSFENACGKLDLDTLSSSGQILDRGGLTKAGRALQKHGGRSDSVFPRPSGNVAEVNQQGQYILDNFLTHPDNVTSQWKHHRFGDIIDIQVPGQGGARFYQNGDFIGFLEPDV